MYSKLHKFASRLHQEKTAAKRDKAARNAALGELLQMKVAGQIDDATFRKTASELMSKQALMGYELAADLSDSEAAALRKHYGLSPDANLKLRNVGRDFLGSALGAAPGLSLMSLAKRGKSPAWMLGGLALGMGGALGGGALAGTKYSKENARRIMTQGQGF